MQKALYEAVEKNQLKILSYLGTHPSGVDRIKNIEKWMPTAMDTYNKSNCKSQLPWFGFLDRWL